MSGERVKCTICGKTLDRAAAVGVNGMWSCAAPKCFGEVLKKQPSVRDLGRQLGLFVDKAKGTP